MDVIGVNGLKGAGKDTVGAYLVETYGFERRSFAALLKESAAACFGIDPLLWETLKNEPGAFVTINQLDETGRTPIKDVSVRQFLQNYGTNAHRNIFGQDFWVDHVLHTLEPGHRYVFTDARFENELEAIISVNAEGYSGEIWQVKRPGSDENDPHPSEAVPPEDLIDHVLVNDGSLGDLWMSIDKLMSARVAA